MQEYEVLRNKNDWLNNYKGKTFNERIQEEVTRGIYEEHSKFKQELNLENILSKITTIPEKYKKIIRTEFHDYAEIKIHQQLAKKSLVSCLDPVTKEIHGLGASSLLRHKVTGKVIDNLILDNFGLYYSIFFGIASPRSISVTDDANTAQVIAAANTRGSNTFQCSNSTFIQMGSGVTAPARGDHVIQTPLGSAPENTYLATNAGAYTASNTIIYQADANPTGGSGTVNEIITMMQGLIGTAVSNTQKNILFARDAVSPGVVYVTGKLLRGAYTWQI